MQNPVQYKTRFTNKMFGGFNFFSLYKKTTMRVFSPKYRQTLIYGALLATLLLLLKWLELRVLIIDHAFELYIGCIAIVFTILGVWLALKLAQPKLKVETKVEIRIIEKEVPVPNRESFTVNGKELAALGMSRREPEVLQFCECKLKK